MVPEAKVAMAAMEVQPDIANGPMVLVSFRLGEETPEAADSAEPEEMAETGTVQEAQEWADMEEKVVVLDQEAM